MRITSLRGFLSRCLLRKLTSHNKFSHVFWKVVCRISDLWNQKLRAAVKVEGNLGLLRSVKCGISAEEKLESLWTRVGLFSAPSVTHDGSCCCSCYPGTSLKFKSSLFFLQAFSSVPDVVWWMLRL